MYIPNRFNDSTIEEVTTFVKQNSFGILINTTASKKLWATHIPMELYENEEGETVLTGHIAKANEQWKAFAENKEVLAVFQGPHAYISPAWYTRKDVPTWNYVAVHIYGHIKIIEGAQLREALRRLIDTNETAAATYMKMDDFPENLIRRELRGVVGFEIAIKEVKAAFKLSQNKNDKTQQTIVEKLESSEADNESAIASYMKQRRKRNFSDKN